MFSVLFFFILFKKNKKFILSLNTQNNIYYCSIILKKWTFFLFLKVYSVLYQTNQEVLSEFKSTFKNTVNINHKELNKAGYTAISCGRVGRGIQPQSTPQVPHSHAQKASKTLISSLFDSCPRTDGPTDRPTDGRTEPPIELRVRN